MSKPVWVQVLWSECSRFKENELMTYIDFEIRVLKAAIKKGYGKGYWKTTFIGLCANNTPSCLTTFAMAGEI